MSVDWSRRLRPKATGTVCNVLVEWEARCPACGILSIWQQWLTTMDRNTEKDPYAYTILCTCGNDSK